MKKFTQILFVALALCGVQTVNALNYSPSDLLLVFHDGTTNGNKDVEYDIGSVSNYLGLAAGTVVPVNFDINLVTTNFNGLGNAMFSVVGATASTDGSLRLWASDANLATAPTDVTGSKYTVLRGKIQSVGDNATSITGGTNGTPLVIAPALANSYSSIVSPGNSSAISTFGGDMPFAVDAANPATLALYEIIPSGTTPKPAATLIGTFTWQANGKMYFVAGAKPGIISYPNRIMSSDQTTTFSVGVTGGTTPVTSYQWYTNGVAVTGATNSTLTVTNGLASSAVTYTVTVGNDAGSVTSAGATLNYSPTDLLLVFRQLNGGTNGYNDVVFDLGSVSNYLGLTAGTVVPVSYDNHLVVTNFGNALNNAMFSVVGGTASGDSKLRVWTSDSILATTPSDVTGSKYTVLRSKIDSVGAQYTAITGGNGSPLVVAPGSVNSYSYIVSPGNSSAISTFGGDMPFPVDYANPSVLALYEVIPSGVTPKPAANLIGSFTMAADGTLTFTAGSIPAFNIAPSTLPDGALATAYSQIVSNINPTLAQSLNATYAVTSGNLPLGLALASNGTISGKPPMFVTNTFTITTIAGNLSSSQSYTVAVNSFGSLTSKTGKAGTLAVTTKNASVFSNLPPNNVMYVSGTYVPAVTTNKPTGLPVPAVVVYRFNGGAWQVASTANTNWFATNSQSLRLGFKTNIFDVYAIDDKGNVTKTNSATYGYLSWQTFTLVQNGGGSISSKLKVAGAGTPPTSSAPGTNTATLAIPGSYYLKASAGAGYLLSNFVVTAGGTTTVVPCPKTYDYPFPMQTNLQIVVNFVTNRFLNCSTGTYWGLFMDTNVVPNVSTNKVAFESAGLIKLNVSAGDKKTGKQTASGAIWAEGQKVPFTVNFNLEGFGTATVTNKVNSDWYTIGMQLDLDGAQNATGTVSNGVKGWLSAITANRSPYGDLTKGFAGDPPGAGNYTMVLDYSNGTNEPGGFGYAALTLGQKGITPIIGKLGDTAPVKGMQTVNVSTGGKWPFYMPMYKDKSTPALFHGSAIGWLTFTNGSIEGSLTWNKKAGVSTTIISTYPNGFTNDFPITASPFDTNSPVLNFSLGYVVVDGGDSGAFSQVFTNNPPSANKPVFGANKIKPVGGVTNNLHNVSLTLASKTGKVSGGFYSDLAKTNTFSYEGVVLQNITNAYGFQVRTKVGTTASPGDATGTVIVQP